MKTAASAFVIFLLLSIAGCSGREVASPIPDTPESRIILELLETYRNAMEARDVDTILALASKDYHDSMGTPDPESDVYYSDLEEKLAADFENVRRIRLNLQVLRIEMLEQTLPEDGPVASVRYRYDVRYQLSMPSGEKWHNALDVNEMLVRRERDGAWRVVSGL